MNYPTWLNTLLIIGGVILFVSLLYTIIAYLSTTKTIFKTSITIPKKGGFFAYYYLPAAQIRITAVAKVEVVSATAGGTPVSPTLKELLVSATTEILPDTSQLLYIEYTGSSFSCDDVKIGVNSMGLLDNVASVTEDRFTNIISALLAAPTSALQKDAALQDVNDAAVTEIKEFTKEFIIEPANVKPGDIDFAWIIMPDKLNTEVQADASFKITLNSPFAETGKAATKVSTVVVTVAAGNGIYVRPSVAMTLAVLPGEKNRLQKIEANTSLCIAPDVSKAILISITRSGMVKKTQSLKLQNGMLLENAVVNPSEAEAFVSIPVNILKAIFAIPSQLFSFRIHHVQDKKNLVTNEAELSKAVLDSEKAKLGSEAELVKAKLEAQKTIASQEQDLLKSKLETQKALIDAEKSKILSETELSKAKLEAQKTIAILEQDVLKAKSDALKAQQELLEIQKKVSLNDNNH